MTSWHRSNTSLSARSTHRPDSRASTTSATSERNLDELRPSTAHSAQASFMSNAPEAMISQWGAANLPGPPQYEQQQYQYDPHQQASFQSQPYAQEPQYVQPDAAYNANVRVGSVPATSDLHDDKRRKGSAVTATNDKELREMLSKNEGRPLKDVAVEVIQKERTPMAEKTKQLFAMLWYDYRR